MEKIPSLGLGTWKISKTEVAEVVYRAIKDIGIRHIDCACDYGNEVEVGFGIKKALDEGLVKRGDLWITSKLWNTYHLSEHVELACRKSLTDLQLDHFDLYSIHFPIAMKFVSFETRYPPEWIHDPQATNPKIELEPRAPMHLTWKAMENLKAKGLTRNIGVCNFNVQLLMDLLSYCEVAPYANQVEMHPFLTQQVLLDFCKSKGIEVTAFSPFAGSSYVELGVERDLGKSLLENQTVQEIASTHGRSNAQVLLRWAVQRGTSVIPKSSQISHLTENTNIFDFTLTEPEMQKLSALNRNLRFNDPGEFCKGMGGAIPIYN